MSPLHNPPRGPRAPGRLSSVSAALRLLKAFSESEVEIGISDLARRLGVAKSTAHRLATTLTSEGMLEQNADTGKYRLGIGLFRLGALVRQRMDVSIEARPLLRELREKANETVHLAVLDGTEIMYIYNLESTQAIRMRSDIGVRKPAYCTAEGQVMLAFQPLEVVERVIRAGLPPRTPQTITDPATLRHTLDVIRQRGCAVEDEESEVGMRCVAAPVRNDSGDVIAAIGLGGPVSRLSKKALAGFVPHVIGTAAAISAKLGYRARPT
ncbi:MAG TPA: IclR family transcriptional regulator [Xanthobacteraceae bacterium]|nr:IclR family transcriptional regulator [Xanthobacteraceae bacterium]